MNELDTLRRMRASLTEPEPVRLAGVRSRVTARFDERGPRVRLPRTGVRVVAVGALAVTIAAGATVAQNLGSVDENGHRRAVLPGLPAGPVANAAQALDRAAVAADSRPFTRPKPNQWIYTETRLRTTVKESGGVTGGPYRTIVSRTWKRADGKKSARIENGRVKIFDEFNRTIPPEDYPSLAALPTDPDALLRWVYAQNGEKPGSEAGYQLAFETLSVILRENLLPPRTEAAIFRAMKKLPGVTLVDNSADAAGRPAIALGRIAEGWLHEEVMLDPKSYAYLGERTISIKGHAFKGAGDDPNAMAGYVKKGVLQNLMVRTAAGIVDEPGQRTS